jgi:hypothetical protein
MADPDGITEGSAVAWEGEIESLISRRKGKNAVFDESEIEPLLTNGSPTVRSRQNSSSSYKQQLPWFKTPSV